jgi:hypothetical protein
MPTQEHAFLEGDDDARTIADHVCTIVTQGEDLELIMRP